MYLSICVSPDEFFCEQFYEHCHCLGALPFYFIISYSYTVQQHISEVAAALVPEIFCANRSLTNIHFLFFFIFFLYIGATQNTHYFSGL